MISRKMVVLSSRLSMSNFVCVHLLSQGSAPALGWEWSQPISRETTRVASLPPQPQDVPKKRKGKRSFPVYPLSCSTPPLCEWLGARFPPLSRTQWDEKLELCIF